jgi:hypothetical protein
MRESVYNALAYSGGSTDPCCSNNDMDFEENCEDDSTTTTTIAPGTTQEPDPNGDCPEGFVKIGVDLSGVPICCPEAVGCDSTGECVSCDSL